MTSKQWTKVRRHWKRCVTWTEAPQAAWYFSKMCCCCCCGGLHSSAKVLLLLSHPVRFQETLLNLPESDWRAFNLITLHMVCSVLEEKVNCNVCHLTRNQKYPLRMKPKKIKRLAAGQHAEGSHWISREVSKEKKGNIISLSHFPIS